MLRRIQPPSGGCVLKHDKPPPHRPNWTQPPSGGCVLKQFHVHAATSGAWPAAFRRLCVETCNLLISSQLISQPPSGGCVLKHDGCFCFR